eukprot:1959754-Alexandrium_andersonii.AAC.2
MPWVLEAKAASLVCWVPTKARSSARSPAAWRPLSATASAQSLPHFLQGLVAPLARCSAVAWPFTFVRATVLGPRWPRVASTWAQRSPLGSRAHGRLGVLPARMAHMRLAAAILSVPMRIGPLAKRARRMATISARVELGRAPVRGVQRERASGALESK